MIIYTSSISQTSALHFPTQKIHHHDDSDKVSHARDLLSCPLD